MKFILLALFALSFTLAGFSQNAWKPVPDKMMTSWGEKVNPDHPLPEYPRPQLVRNDWVNLNGLWQYNILPKSQESIPASFAGNILVPFAVESTLSGVGKTVGKDSVLWYEREFSLPASFKHKTILLQFGAVDWLCDVYVNGKKAGTHQGGYDPFSMDITDALNKKGMQKISVRVWDPTDDGPQPRGKQVKDPHGIWYTSVTGIWQTVWLEAVPKTYVQSTRQTADIDKQILKVDASVVQPAAGDQLLISAWKGNQKITEQAVAPDQQAALSIPGPELWSPAHPFLYDLKIAILRKGKKIDEVGSYFAMRKISMGPDKNGIQRMLLNNQFLFQFGPLDQGWWPDGLYTAPTDEALRFDIEKTKEMGFDLIRKHVKVEPARWYHYCDQLGMLVWQDMPSGDLGNHWESRPGVYGRATDKDRSPESEKIYREEWNEIMQDLYNFPSIVVWTPFNEAWGQFKTKDIVTHTMEKDPSRLVNTASGGNFVDIGPIIDLHNYPDPLMPDPDLFGAKRILVLGEFGGLGLPVEGHTWQQKNNWGYQTFKTKDELLKRYTELVDRIPRLIEKGLSAAVYTQTTDVEGESNGFMTYDRKVFKMPVEALNAENSKLYNPSLVVMRQATQAEVVPQVSNQAINAFYISGKAPLQKGHFIKLPVTSVKPGGWLKKQLELQRDGLTGHLGEISIWLSKKDNAWLNKEGKGKYGWEELPYWLKGYGDIAYMLGDEKMIKETTFWIDAVLNNQRENGDFGPMVLRNGTRDLWTNMPMLWCLQSYYEYAKDPRVIQLMSKYFKWELSLPDNHFLEDYWEKSRGGDNLYSVYWLYNRTGEKWLLDLASKIDRNTADWRQKDNLPNWHNVNIAQSFREPATYYLQSHKSADLDATYNDFKLVRTIYGQVPGGMFGADENARKGYDDPRQAVEACGMVEQMTSDEMLLRMTGDTYWAENCEDVAFNTFPAAFMPDFRSLRYLTAPNMVVSDSKNHSPGIDNNGPFLMMNPFSSRCCQHNHAAGWVYYAENSWMATPDNGLAAQLYSESSVTAKVGDGTTVEVSEQTHYPFEENVNFSISTSHAVIFPLYLRIPDWCTDAVVSVNGEKTTIVPQAGAYVKLTRQWESGDKIVVELPMKLKLRTWSKNKNSVSVNYGPLTFSLKIKERYVQKDSKETAIGDSKWQENADAKKWPSYEIYPASAWNYGILIDSAEPAKSFTVKRRDWPADNNPFTNESAPIVIEARGKEIPFWTIDQYGLCGILPQSPVVTRSPETALELVPMGGARLRISAFPVVE